ncbi:MAG: hypothetical protein BMS9Abin17_0917 [Acidimicrobiia bacterium]|nr:MAG: hypothetical protein BMS9Abin17_0917 [Acidimicrobiia bacterium]
MVWYNNPEYVKAIHDARRDQFVSEQRRLMRLAREESSID